MIAPPGIVKSSFRKAAPGEIIELTLGGEEIVLISSLPTGYAAILCPAGWKAFQRWKLTSFRVANGSLRACGKGRPAGFVAARFLLNPPTNSKVFHRNGNLFDIRLSNIVAIPRSLLKQAGVEAARGPDYGRDVQLRDGRRRSYRKPMVPSARRRIGLALENTPGSEPTGDPG
ncbi:hypothetical protein ABIA99_005198 [Bradyrhizobium sp. LB12.1]|uniref:HNH endonuclease n=1 Tax=Bradyrhizobium sp. LB12.1 TaxID=3156327 RepID=UPI003391D480